MTAPRAGLRHRWRGFVDRFHQEQSLAGAMWTWCVLAAGTAGFASGPLLWYAGRRLHQPRLRGAAYGYVALTAVVLVAARVGPSGRAVLAAAWAGLWLLGGTHAAIAGRQVWYACRPDQPPPTAYPMPDESAVEWARWRSERRRRARHLVATDPGMAAELRIGRPDLPRRYDDGGLVDVNHVPVAVLRDELRLPVEVARRVVDERILRRGFGSADELIVFCELPPDLVATIRDRLLFGPRG